MEKKFKVGDKVRYKNQKEDGFEVYTVAKIHLGKVFYEEDGFDNITDLELVTSVVPHYNSTSISALNVIDDAINPSHYNGTEVFDQMLLLYGVEAVKGFCICNAFKYRQRAGKKSDKTTEDINKALWYESKFKGL